MQKFLEFGRKWWPSVIVLAAILWLTLAPHPVGDTEIELFPGADKLVHAIMMGGLAFMLLFDYSRKGTWRNFRRIPPRITFITAFCCIFFSLADEWAQGIMNLGRSSDPLDLVADIFGIIFASVIAGPVIRCLPFLKK
ncbi:MAG: VanZ family protein [Muribaculaceae bacterium]|nr:VanZ family protein [Muribaculaceae bacterium]